MPKVPLLANDFVTVYESPNPAGAYCYTPGIIRLDSGRLVATMDLGGPEVDALNPPISFPRAERGFTFVGKIFTSDDAGQTWIHRGDFAGMHARPVIVGNRIYIIGQAHDLIVLYSEDEGETWSETYKLTEGENWHQSACNVHYTNGCVYLVMEKRIYFEQKVWPVHETAPVLMRAPIDADLTKRESWTFASELAFHDVLPDSKLDLMGFPFWTPYETRGMAPMGWLETNIVQFLDPNHVWHDPTGHTFHLWMRAHTGGTGYAAIAKVVENPDGSMTTSIEQMPSGQRVLFVPCPGGQMRFHVLYDQQTQLFWLLSSLAWDSMTHIDKLPPDRYNLPNNERHVLALHFSKNMIDWRMAGVVAQGNSAREARHYASMTFDGDDLLVLSRSGDHRAKTAHDGNLITFHRVQNFRDLVY